MNELYNALKSTGYDVAYSHFKTKPTLPFIAYYRDSKENISSDTKIHNNWQYFTIELYTDKKDLQAEKRVEDILKNFDVDYNTHETYIDSEKMYQIVYEIKILGGN